MRANVGSPHPPCSAIHRSLAELLDRRAVRRIRTRPYTPRTTGKVERFHQTLMREWAYALEYASSDARRRANRLALVPSATNSRSVLGGD